MKRLTKSIILSVILGSFGSALGQEDPQHPDSLLRHVVLFKFKSEASEAQIREVTEAFLSLPAKIPEIHGMEWGLNNSPEGLNKELTHCFMLTFRTEKDRDAYLPHPQHLAFTDLAGPIIEDVLVVDYWGADQP